MSHSEELLTRKLADPSKQLLQEMARVKSGPDGAHIVEWLEKNLEILKNNNSVILDDSMIKQGQGSIQILNELLYYFCEGKKIFNVM